MKHPWKWYFPLVVSLVMAAAEQGNASNIPQGGLIVEAKGEVLLSRQGWSDYYPTAVGAQLYPGDRLLPTQGATVTVLCADLTRLTLSGGETWCLASNEPPEEPQRQGGDTIPPRSDVNPLIPYIISPRSTAVLALKPILRWNAVPGATRYTLRIVSDEDVLWEAESTVTEVVYPGEPPLDWGVDYLLIVDADTGASSQEEDVPSRGFRRLDENQAQRVRFLESQLDKLELTSEALVLAKAHLYIGYELRSPAIAMLEAVVKQGSNTAAVYRILGDLYAEVGLNRLALTRYLRAVDLATEIEDVEGQAVASVSLGEAYKAVGNIEAASQWLARSRDGYAALGDVERVSELEKQIGRLNL